MQKTKNEKLQRMVLVGVLSALVFALNIPSIRVSSVARLHLGNIMCLLSGILFGPVTGGLAAGIGSMLYDFTDPLFLPEFWITFINKFLMAFVAGKVYRMLQHKKTPVMLQTLAAAIAGSVTYTTLYLSKMALMLHFISGTPWPGVWPVVGASAVTSLINSSITVVAVLILAPILNKALDSSGLFQSLRHHN